MWKTIVRTEMSQALAKIHRAKRRVPVSEGLIYVMRNRRFVFRTLAGPYAIPDDESHICRDHAIAQTEYAQIDRWGSEFF